MTKYDIRLRREAVKKSQIEKYKDFRSLSDLVQQEKRATSNRRLWILLVAAVLILGMMVVGTIRILNPPKQEQKENVDQLIFEEFKSE